MDKDVETHEYKSEKQDFSVSSYINNELRQEINRISEINSLYENEIKQLRKEREVLFEQLKLLKGKKKYPKMDFGDIISHDYVDTPKCDSSSQTDDDILHFSKKNLVEYIDGCNNKVFQKIYDEIEFSDSGETVLKYITKQCSFKIDALCIENSVLRDENIRLQMSLGRIDIQKARDQCN